MNDKKRSVHFTKVMQHPFSVLAGGFILLLITQLFGSVALQFISKTTTEPIRLATLLIVSFLTLLLILAVLLKVCGKSWRSFGVRKPRGPWLRLLVGSAILYVLLSVTLMTLATLALPGFDATQSQEVGLTKLGSYPELVLGFVSLVILTPIIEELIFRGVIFRGLSRTLPLWFAVGFSSVLFAIAHGQWNVAIDTFVLGIFLAYVTHKTGSLIPAIILHGLKNGVAYVLLFVVAR